MKTKSVDKLDKENEKLREEIKAAAERELKFKELLHEESHLQQLIAKLERGMDLSMSGIHTTPDKSGISTADPTSKLIKAVLNDDKTQVTLVFTDPGKEKARMMQSKINVVAADEPFLRDATRFLDTS